MSVPRRRLTALAALFVVALATSGCSAIIDFVRPKPGVSQTANPIAEVPDKPSSITITWLAFMSGGGGTTGETTITRTPPSKPGDFRIEFSQDEVGGIGGSSQAGAWNAAIVSTLLLGQPLEGEFAFATDGRVDGPSAGALTTAGLIALARGETFLEGVTMTGTINATGTVGPVGGIPEKIQGAADAGFTKVFIPLGQRNTPSAETGDLVDVVRLGERLGVEVSEVGDIYEAYSGLTGETLEVPGVARDPRLDDAAYDKIAPQAQAALARYTVAQQRIARLPQELQAILNVFVVASDEVAARSSDLSRQGLQAGAYVLAAQAAAYIEAIAAAGEMYMPLYSQGIDGIGVIFSQALDTSAAEAEFFSYLDRLNAYTPKNIADVEGLVSAYSGAFDNYSLLSWAQGQIEQINANFENGVYTTLDEMFGAMTVPVIYSELARGLLRNGTADFEIGRDNAGSPIADDADLAQIGDFFRKGAEANFEAFTESVVTEYASSYGVSEDVMLSNFAAADIDVALAMNQQATLAGIANYVGDDNPNQAYAVLGYGIANYTRNQALMDKWYNNAVTDENLNIIDVQYDAVLGRALDLGRQQLADQINALRDEGTEPVISVGLYEYAGLNRQQTITEQFEAIAAYDKGFIMTRMLAYVGGFLPVS